MRIHFHFSLALWAGTASAQAPLRDAGARMERVSDGVYAIIHENATDQWPHGNTGVILGDDGVLVVDAAYLPSRAKADIALIRRVTDQPIRWLVITHWHFDHNNGISAYRDAFPGIQIISERETRAWIDINNTWWPRMSTADSSARRASLGKLEEQLRSGADSTGRRLPAEERKTIEDNVRRRRGELAELAGLQVVLPNLTFERELDLWLGRRKVELRDQGRANSPHDVTIYLPQEKVLFTGDILVHDPLPYVGASWPVPWSGVLRRLEAVPVAALVPGHGPVMKDHRYTRQVRELMEATSSRVDSLARRGFTLEQVQATIKLDDIRASYAPWAEAPEEDWQATVTTLVERAWRGVRGQG
jgi:glyoxylase-like metal-dependent hydrolase (beta-lactamase superfamily II)